MRGSRRPSGSKRPQQLQLIRPEACSQTPHQGARQLLHMRPLVLLPQLMLLSPLLNLGHLVLLTQFVMLLMPLVGGVLQVSHLAVGVGLLCNS